MRCGGGGGGGARAGVRAHTTTDLARPSCHPAGGWRRRSEARRWAARGGSKRQTQRRQISRRPAPLPDDAAAPLSHNLSHIHTELRRRQSNTTNHGSHRRHQEDGKKGDGVKREGRSAAAAGRSAARFCLPAAAGAGANRLLAPSTPRARQGRARRIPYRGGTQWYAAWHTQPAAHTPPRSGRRRRSPPLPSPSFLPTPSNRKSRRSPSTPGWPWS